MEIPFLPPKMSKQQDAKKNIAFTLQSSNKGNKTVSPLSENTHNNPGTKLTI